MLDRRSDSVSSICGFGYSGADQAHPMTWASACDGEGLADTGHILMSSSPKSNEPQQRVRADARRIAIVLAVAASSLPRMRIEPPRPPRGSYSFPLGELRT